MEFECLVWARKCMHMPRLNSAREVWQHRGTRSGRCCAFAHCLRCCVFACCSGPMFEDPPHGSHGCREDEACFSSSSAGAVTTRQEAMTVLKDLGIERFTRGEFNRTFKQKFGGRSRVLGTGSFATVFLHRDCRPAAGPGEFVATKTPKQDIQQDGLWHEILYQAVASQDCEHIVKVRAWIDDAGIGGVASPANDGFGGTILEYCRDLSSPCSKHTRA